MCVCMRAGMTEDQDFKHISVASLIEYCFPITLVELVKINACN